MIRRRSDRNQFDDQLFRTTSAIGCRPSTPLEASSSASVAASTAMHEASPVSPTVVNTASGRHPSSGKRRPTTARLHVQIDVRKGVPEPRPRRESESHPLRRAPDQQDRERHRKRRQRAARGDNRQRPDHDRTTTRARPEPTEDRRAHGTREQRDGQCPLRRSERHVIVALRVDITVGAYDRRIPRARRRDLSGCGTTFVP